MIVMLYRIIGSAGSGKTEYLFKKIGQALKNKKQCYVIVPEQQSVAYESAICKEFGDESNLYLEVLNFERLPNRIARDFGGLAVENIDKGGACALLSLVVERLKPQLKEYSSLATDSDFVTSLFSLISKMKMSLITPEKISNVLENSQLIEDNRLLNKLYDIRLIYSEYEKYFGDELFDPRDALTKLAKELPNKEFFKDCYVFIDGYYNFTGQEYKIIKEIISQSVNTYITFTIDETRSFFSENQYASNEIYRLAGNISNDYYTDEHCDLTKRFKSESIAFLERNIWRSGVTPLNVNDGSVRLITSNNRFDETEAAADVILDYIRKGGRYRDIAVVTGSPDNYRTLVDSVFSRAEIPVYLSAKEPLYIKPLFAFLLSSLAVINEDFSLRSMKRYIKSGYTELTIAESDILINYATSWNIRGKGWYSQEDWTLDPEGYREGDLSERGAALLKIANDSKNKIIPPLSALRDSLHQNNLTVSMGVKALYYHLISMNADEILRKNAERYLKNGDREKSEREVQLWKIMVNIFDQLDKLCGNIEITPKRLHSLIKLMCDCYSLGAIPPSADSVTFGDASLIRAGGCKMVLVLGVCDGEFPASTSVGFFDRQEAMALEGGGLALADSMDKQLNASRFMVYSAFASPSEKLVLFSPRSEISGGELRPSTAWLSVTQMLPQVKIENFDVTSNLYSRDSIAANFSCLEDGELKEKIRKSLESKGVEFFKETPKVCDFDSKIEFEDTKLNLSPSKFERYALCPFSFFGNYLLKLKEKKVNEFSMPEIGNFIHKILDQFLSSCVENGKFVCPNESERKALVSKLSKDYLFEVIGNQAENDKRFMHTYGNMIRTIDLVAENLCKEFSQSKFVPTGFEYKIGAKDESGIPAIEYDVDGKKVYLRGSIDRVDTYDADGVKYARVIDYKTYAKSFNPELVEQGIDTQLLHYLFAYCEMKGYIPAGALYYGVSLPKIKISGSESEEEIKEKIEKELKRKGILLKDTSVVQAMSPNCEFVPASINKDGSFSKACKNLFTHEDFQNLSDTLKNSINHLSNQVFCGNMDIAPNEMDGKTEPCKYCALADLCRNKKQKEDDDNGLYDDAE